MNPKRRSSTKLSPLAALAEALALVAWTDLFKRLNTPHTEQRAAQHMRDRAPLLRIAARAARDLAFEMRATHCETPWWNTGEEPGLPPEHLHAFYKAVDTGVCKAFRPSGNTFLDEYLHGPATMTVLQDHLSIEGVRPQRFDLATATADSVWRFGLGLRRVADLMERYPDLFTIGEARRLRPGHRGKLPDLAVHHLVSKCKEHGIGFREAARRICALGIDLDAECWTVDARDGATISSEEIDEVADRLRKAARRPNAKKRSQGRRK